MQYKCTIRTRLWHDWGKRKATIETTSQSGVKGHLNYVLHEQLIAIVAMTAIIWSCCNYGLAFDLFLRNNRSSLLIKTISLLTWMLSIICYLIHTLTSCDTNYLSLWTWRRFMAPRFYFTKYHARKDWTFQVFDKDLCDKFSKFALFVTSLLNARIWTSLAGILHLDSIKVGIKITIPYIWYFKTFGTF